MRFDPITCPEPACGETARGTLERVAGVALLDVHDDGTADYAGDTDIFWDEQRSVRDEQDKATLMCPHGHDWKATVDAGPDPREPVWDDLAPRMLETLRALLTRGMAEDPGSHGTVVRLTLPSTLGQQARALVRALEDLR